MQAKHCSALLPSLRYCMYYARITDGYSACHLPSKHCTNSGSTTAVRWPTAETS